MVAGCSAAGRKVERPSASVGGCGPPSPGIASQTPDEWPVGRSARPGWMASKASWKSSWNSRAVCGLCSRSFESARSTAVLDLGHRAELRGDLGERGGRHRGVLVHDLPVVPLEREPPGQELVDHHRDRVDVGPAVDVLAAQGLLGAPERGGADEADGLELPLGLALVDDVVGVVADLGDPEVEDLEVLLARLPARRAASCWPA